MAERDKSSKAAIAIGATAAVAAAIALLSKRAQAASTGVVSLDEATMNLLIAIAQSIQGLPEDSIEALTKLEEIKTAIGNLVMGGGGGIVPNADYTLSMGILLPVAFQAYQLPVIPIPDDMSLAIKSWPFNAAGSLVLVASSATTAINITSAWPLIRNESITYKIKNAHALFVSTTIGGSIVMISAEQRS